MGNHQLRWVVPWKIMQCNECTFNALKLIIRKAPIILLHSGTVLKKSQLIKISEFILKREKALTFVFREIYRLL